MEASVSPRTNERARQSGICLGGELPGALTPGEDEATITQAAKVFELLKPWEIPEEIEVERVANYTILPLRGVGGADGC